jgi:hypothetical protein
MVPCEAVAVIGGRYSTIARLRVRGSHCERSAAAARHALTAMRHR